MSKASQLPLDERPASEEDIDHHYRLFLAREAETRAVVLAKVDQNLLETMIAFLTSDEFSDKLGLVDGALEVADEMLLPLDPATAAWASTMANVDRAAGWSPERLTSIGDILRLPAVGQAYDAGAGDRPYGSAALIDALAKLDDAVRVIANSSLFDPVVYASQLSGGRPSNLAMHYALRGERLGLKPSANFDALAYRLNNADLRHETGNLLHHFETIGRAQGRLTIADYQDHSHESVEIVRSSALFDEDYYRSQLGENGRFVEDAALHYLSQGERRGLRPSSTFDAAVYADIHADIATSSVNRLVHYESYGRAEKRAYRSWIGDHVLPPVTGGGDRPVVLLLLHEATYTGAPILGWNLAQALSNRCEIVVVLRRDGALEGALRDVAAAVVSAPPREAADDPQQLRRFARRLAATYRPAYAIANSVETRLFAMALRDHDVPIVALIHEFWPGARPGVRLPFYARCAALVFPARLVERSSYHAFREIRLQNSHILPQGPSVVPPFDRSATPIPFGAPFLVDDDTPPPLETLLDDGGEGPFTVIGLGAIEMRKGIDLFIAAATALKAKHPGLPYRFIWIGTWEHALATPYAALLEEQWRRSGLEDRLFFYPAVDRLEPVYARADALFLSSRLDPLPNITIDAAFRGIPVICFDQASGIAELLSADPDTAALVVPHLDSGAAADRLADLARDPERRAACAAAMRRLAAKNFDMVAYAARLHEWGCQAADKFALTDRDEALIAGTELFDPALFFASDHPVAPAGATLVAAYLDETRHINFSSAPVFGMELRRPSPGFHPLVYGNEAAGFPRDGSRDPLAHFIEQGMPPGRWRHRVLRPEEAPLDPARRWNLSGTAQRLSGLWKRPAPPVALHGHFHYADNINEFLHALSVNRLRADLFLTTTNTAAADRLRAATSTYRDGDVLIETGPNVGRDIYSFLRVMRAHVRGRYAIVGHLHGKRSVHTLSFDQDLGNRWRRFLWEHLLGPTYRAADLIVEAMQGDERLGLVFPENDYLIGWEKNGASAAALATRLGLRGALPGHIEFPVGTMFWARVDALAALVDADLREDEMPPEPLPIDGTMLHALERMLPILCGEAGYEYATTYIPNVRR